MGYVEDVTAKVKMLVDRGETDYATWLEWLKQNIPGHCEDKGDTVGIHSLFFIAQHTMSLAHVKRFGLAVHLWLREGIVYQVDVFRLSFRARSFMGSIMIYPHKQTVVKLNITAAHSKIREVYRRRLCSDIKNVADGLLARRSGMSVLNSGVSGDCSFYWRQPDGLRQAKHCPVDAIVWMRELRPDGEVVRIHVYPDEGKQVTGIYSDGKITWLK